MEFYLIFVRHTERKKFFSSKAFFTRAQSIHPKNCIHIEILSGAKKPSSRSQWSYPFRMPNVNDRLHKIAQ